MDLLARDFQVPRIFAAYRAKDLKLITEAEHKANFRDRILF
jgi:Zn-dependent peptidase ImmA (M78 family)